MRRSLWPAALLPLCLLAGCGSATTSPAVAYVYTVSPSAATAGFGIAEHQSFAIVLPGAAAPGGVAVGVAPAGVVSRPGGARAQPGGLAYTFAALHTGTATVSFRCAACAAGEQHVAIAVHVLP